MATKELNELQAASVFDSGDLMLIRKSGQGVDQKITRENVIKSIGNSAVDGFVASVDTDVNEVTVVAANGVMVDSYYEGMKISFISPVDSTGIVNIKIGTLEFKLAQKLKEDTTIKLINGDYIELVYTGGKFRQVNAVDLTPAIFTNDYIVANITYGGGGIATTIELISAFGMKKTSYYEGMVINFTCTRNTQGFVRVKIDELPLSDLTPDVDGGIPLKLFANQMVQAIYRDEFASFRPNTFYTLDPMAFFSVKPDPENADQTSIRPEDKHTYFVGTVGTNNFTNLRIAIDSLIKEYKKDGSGFQVTLIITSDLKLSDSSIYINDMNLSWITLKAKSNNTIKFIDDLLNSDASHFIFSSHNCTGFLNFEKDTIIEHNTNNTIVQNGFFNGNGSQIKLKNIIINTTNINSNSSSQNFVFFIQWDNNITLNNVVLNNGKTFLNTFSGKSVITLESCRFHNYQDNSILMNSPNSEISITNCDLSKSGVSANTDIKINSYCQITQINSRAKSNYPKDTFDKNCRYSVTGTQDDVGS